VIWQDSSQYLEKIRKGIKRPASEDLDFKEKDDVKPAKNAKMYELQRRARKILGLLFCYPRKKK